NLPTGVDQDGGELTSISEEGTSFDGLQPGLQPGKHEVCDLRKNRCQQSQQRGNANAQYLKPELDSQTLAVRYMTQRRIPMHLCVNRKNDRSQQYEKNQYHAAEHLPGIKGVAGDCDRGRNKQP